MGSCPVLIRLTWCGSRTVQGQIASLAKEVQQLRERIYVPESRPSLQDSQLGTIAADMDNLKVQLALTQKVVNTSSSPPSIHDLEERLHRIETLLFNIPDLKELDSAISRSLKKVDNLKGKRLDVELPSSSVRPAGDETGRELTAMRIADLESVILRLRERCNSVPTVAEKASREGELLRFAATSQNATQSGFAVGDVIKLEKDVRSDNSAILLSAGLVGKVLRVEPATDDDEQAILLSFPAADWYSYNEHWVGEKGLRHLVPIHDSE